MLLSRYMASDDSPKHLLTAEEAEALLKPHMDRLDRCIQHGWDAWETDYKHKHHLLSAGSRAHIVFDEIKTRAFKEFTGVTGVQFKNKARQFLLFIGDGIILRFKKLGKNGKTSNILTRQQMMFNLQLQLPGIPLGTLVNAGYQLNDLQSKLASKLVVCQWKNAILWRIVLDKNTGGEVLPIATTEPSGPLPQKARVRLKDSSRKVQEEKKQKGKTSS